MARILIIIISILGVVSCNIYNTKKDGIVVAKVGNKKLMQSEISDIISKNATAEDSLFIADNYIRQWITKQLIINKAKLNLSDKQKDVSKLVEDYRSSLLIHSYQQNFVSQKLDTIITDDEVIEYYNKYENNFILNKNLVKATFVKIKKPLKEKNEVAKMLKSEAAEDAEKLEDFCFQRATNYDTFNREWIDANTLWQKIPLQIDDKIKFLSKKKYVAVEDSLFCYFLKINDAKLKKTTAPIEYVKDNVKKIIINKRKVDLITNLERDIYNDAKDKNKFKIY